MKRIILTSAIAATLLFMGIPVMSAAESATSTTKAQEPGITATTSAEPTIKINSGNLEISVPDDTIYNFNIYSITGQLVKPRNSLSRASAWMLYCEVREVVKKNHHPIIPNTYLNYSPTI